MRHIYAWPVGLRHWPPSDVLLEIMKHVAKDTSKLKTFCGSSRHSLNQRRSLSSQAVSDRKAFKQMIAHTTLPATIS